MEEREREKEKDRKRSRLYERGYKIKIRRNSFPTAVGFPLNYLWNTLVFYSYNLCANFQEC